MSGTRSGGIQGAQTNKKRYGDNFYHRIGAIAEAYVYLQAVQEKARAGG